MAKITISTYDRALPVKQTSLTLPADDAVGDAAVQALVDAMDAVLLGSDVKGVVTVPNIVDAGAPGPAASQLADRGNKLLIRTSVPADNGGDGAIYTNEIGTFDNTTLPGVSSDFLDLTAGVGLALKTAWDAVYVSAEGNAGTMLSAQQVNRSAN